MSSNVQIPVEGANRDESIWVRGLFMLLFVVIFWVAELVIAAVAIVQFGWVVFSGERNERLLHFSVSLGRFVYQALQYWMFNSDEKPFPFAEWPRET